VGEKERQKEGKEGSKEGRKKGGRRAERKQSKRVFAGNSGSSELPDLSALRF
jgi:hypothetical protein